MLLVLKMYVLEVKILDRDFKDTILEIKNEISKTQTLVMSDANVRLINMYFNIGKIINLNGEVNLFKNWK